MLCEKKDGTSVKVPVNNDISKAIKPHFLKRAAELQIPVVDET